MNDFSEVTSGIDKKINSLNHALNDKKVDASIVILQDVINDFENLIVYLKLLREKKSCLTLEKDSNKTNQV